MKANEYYDESGFIQPMFSYSTAKTIVMKSPYHAWREHPKLGGKKRKSTAAMDMGTLIGMFVAGDDDLIEVLDFDSYRTNAAQSARDEAIDAGLTPVLASKAEEYREAANAVHERALSFDFDLKSMIAEHAITWDSEGVACKSRLDFWDQDRLIIDLKTINDASVDSCIRSICDMGYDIQAAAYTMAVEFERPKLAGRIRFVNLFVETEPPYLMTPIEQDEGFLTIGRAKWERARNIWSRCLKTGHWPAYVEKTTKVIPPSWAVHKEMNDSSIYQLGANNE